MNNKKLLVILLAVLTFAGIAQAQTGSGTLGVTVNVQGSVNLTSRIAPG